jgi:hypothetical protein
MAMHSGFIPHTASITASVYATQNELQPFGYMRPITAFARKISVRHESETGETGDGYAIFFLPKGAIPIPLLVVLLGSNEQQPSFYCLTCLEVYPDVVVGSIILPKK